MNIDYKNGCQRKLSQKWKEQHIPILLSSLIISAFMVILALLIVNPYLTSINTYEMVVFLMGFYFVFFILATILHYLFHYLPNYYFYKKMMKNGQERTIFAMVEKHSLSVLIKNNWFISPNRSGLENLEN